MEEDIPMKSVLEELGRRIEPYGLKPSEALNWMLSHPQLDDFFSQIVEFKKRTLQ